MLNRMQENIIDGVCKFYFEDIENLENRGFANRSLLTLKALLSSEVLEEKEPDIQEAVAEIHNILSAEHPFLLLGLNRSNVAGANNSGTDRDVKDYLLAQINARIHSLETKKNTMEAAFGRLDAAEELFNLILTPKAREILLTEPILSKAKNSTTMATLEDLSNRVNKAAALIPVASAVNQLIDMEDKQYEAATRIIKTLKTGYTDKKATELFLKFIRENKNIARMVEMGEPALHSVIRRFAPRMSPERFINNHPEFREKLVSMDDDDFAKAVAALNDPNVALQYFVNKYPGLITELSQMDEAQQVNIKLALEDPRTNSFIERYPNKFILFADKNEEQIRRAIIALDNQEIVRLLNRNPDRITDFMDFTEPQLINIINAAQSKATFDLLYASPEEYLTIFSSMTEERLSSIQTILTLGKKSFDNYPEQLELILKMDDTQLTRIIPLLDTDSEIPSFTLLTRAIVEKNIEAVNALINGGADLNFIDKNICTPLTYAINTNNIEAVNVLVAGGVDLNFEDKIGRTPLTHAILEGNNEIVNALINGRADLNFIDKNGGIPLKIAILGRNNEVVNALIDGGADLNFEDEIGWTPLTNAMVQKDIEALNALIAGGADLNFIDKNGWTPLTNAMVQKNIEAVNALINGGADLNFIDKNGCTPLTYAINKNNIEALNALIVGRADLNFIDKKGDTPLIHAMVQKNIEALNALIVGRADLNFIDKNGWTPLTKAINTENIEAVNALVEAGAKLSLKDKPFYSSQVNEVITELFKEAINDNNVKSIDNLLKHYPEYKEKDLGRGRTLLSYAIVKEKPEIAAYMVEQGFMPQRTWTDIINKMSALDLDKTPDEVAKEVGGETKQRYFQRKLMDERKKGVDKIGPIL